MRVYSYVDIVKSYYYLAKPGIVYGNAITAIAGFFLATDGTFNVGLFVAMLVGICLVMASGCVFNNYIDRGIDKKMARTKKRALVSGKISGQSALVYGTILGVIGFGSLVLWTNWLTVAAAAVGFVDYVVLYGIAKRGTVHGTVVGSIAGAVPPVVGYVAVTNQFDMGALLLFLILVCWQMPHFYAIATYRLKDYKAAGIPVLPAVSGERIAKVTILAYVILFAIMATLLYTNGYTNIVYLVVMLLLSVAWFWLGVRGFHTANNAAWAKKMFKFSLIVLLTFSVLISFGRHAIILL